MFSSDYVDNSGSPGIAEHIFPASIIDNDPEKAKKVFNSDDYNLLTHVLKICARKDAFYFRIIE